MFLYISATEFSSPVNQKFHKILVVLEIYEKKEQKRNTSPKSLS
jgi:hypothetical protein